MKVHIIIHLSLFCLLRIGSFLRLDVLYLCFFLCGLVWGVAIGERGAEEEELGS